jgi:hypothetical protein
MVYQSFIVIIPRLKNLWKTKTYFQAPLKASYILFYDLNHDYILDAVVGVLNQKSELSKLPLRVYQGKLINGSIQFFEVKDAIPMKAQPTSTVALLDYDQDGNLDLFVGNWFGLYKINHFLLETDFSKEMDSFFLT